MRINVGLDWIRLRIKQYKIRITEMDNYFVCAPILPEDYSYFYPLVESESRHLHGAVSAVLRLHREFQPQNNWSDSRLGDTTPCISNETLLKWRHALTRRSNFELKRLSAVSQFRYALERPGLPCMDLKLLPNARGTHGLR